MLQSREQFVCCPNEIRRLLTENDCDNVYFRENIGSVNILFAKIIGMYNLENIVLHYVNRR